MTEPAAIDLIPGTVLCGRFRVERLLCKRAERADYLAEDESTAQLVLVEVDAGDGSTAPASGVALLARGSTPDGRATFRVREARDEDIRDHLESFLGFEAALPMGAGWDTAPPSSRPEFQEIPPGSLVGGRYVVDALLGRGGMGEVYRGHDRLLDRAVALKLVRPTGVSARTASDARRSVVREARLISRVDHPNIVRLFDAGEHEESAYLALEICEGGSLRSKLGTATREEKERWIREIADAIAHAHGAGILHRDIKPENVVLTADGTAKLTDFGIARAIESAEGGRTTASFGTPRYMAPEALLGETVDARADQYAWALVAVEVWTGVPFRIGAQRDAATLRKLGIPGPLARVLPKCLEPDREARYPTMDAALADLADERGLVAPARRRWRTGMIAGLAVVALAALSAAGIRRHRVDGGGESERAPGPSATSASLPELSPDVGARCASPARADLAAGVQLWADGSPWRSVSRLSSAVAADRECAAGYYYLTLASPHWDRRRREAFYRALELRSRLLPREREILTALAPAAEDPPNRAEAARRLSELSDADPSDLNVRRLFVGWVFNSADYERVLALLGGGDESATGRPAWEHLMSALARVGLRDTHAAHRIFARCLEEAPDSESCLTWYGWLKGAEGDCVGAEQLARRLIRADPSSATGHDLLAQTLYEQTDDPAVAEQELRARWRSSPQASDGRRDDRAVTEAGDAYRIAVLRGDFAEAERAVVRWRELTAAASHQGSTGAAALEHITLLREMGRTKDAAAEAKSVLASWASWARDERVDWWMEMPRLAFRTGAISRAELVTWNRRWQALPSHPAHGAQAMRWLASYPDDGRPVDSGAPVPDLRRPILDEYLAFSPFLVHAGDAALASGNADLALVQYEASARRCFFTYPLSKFQSFLPLAKLRAQRGDIAGACAALDRIRHVWKPGSVSVTAREAQSLAESFSCPHETTMGDPYEPQDR